MSLHRHRIAAALAAGGLLSACGATGPGPPEDRADGGTLTVLAAASLTESFGELADRFEAAHPRVEVRLAFDSSATLALQVAQGAPADVLATADQRTMRTAMEAGSIAGSPRVFATNRLELVVPADNPAGIDELADLNRRSVDYVVCVESAPCGALAARVLGRQGIRTEPASEEVDVKAVLSKVELNEADAGIVYESDAVAADDAVQGIEIPATGKTTTRYPMAVVDGAEQPELAAEWLRLVLSDRGRRALRDAGFGTP